MDRSIEAPDWSTIPAPSDDGATRHLPGSRVPSVALTATDGTAVDLATLAGRTVVYAYPRTGQPGLPNPDGWDMIPGARGCTPQSCAFRDHFAELQARGVDRVYGLSTQDTAYQREAAARLHLPFALLSDDQLELTRAMRLPTFETAGMTCSSALRSSSTPARSCGLLSVFPPDSNASGSCGSPCRHVLPIDKHGVSKQRRRVGPHVDLRIARDAKPVRAETFGCCAPTPPTARSRP